MSDWGQGANNNNIGWGQGAFNNSIDWGLSHKEENSWSGETDLYGSVFNPITVAYSERVLADGGIIEALACVDAVVNTF